MRPDKKKTPAQHTCEYGRCGEPDETWQSSRAMIAKEKVTHMVFL